MLYSDINLRLDIVDSSDIMAIYDSDAIKQNLISLVSTEVGEVWNYRAYGLDLKQFLHYPLTPSTAREIESYITGRISRFITNVTYLDYASRIIFDYNNNSLKFELTYQINATKELINLPVVTIILNR